MTFHNPFAPIYTCAICGGSYSGSSEAKQAHYTVMQHPPRPKENKEA